MRYATFTSKNYASLKEIKLGNTNPFRVFASVSPMGAINTYNRFNRMISCFKKHETNHSMAPAYFYKIRAIYELTGARQTYLNSDGTIDNKLSYAKFLIWNNPGSETVRVIPTSKIIYNIINSIDKLMPKSRN